MKITARKPRLALVGEQWPVGPVVGWLVGLDAQGRASVDFAGNPRGPVAARSTVQLAGEALDLASGRVEVLLAFPASEDGPVIVGVVHESLLARPVDSRDALVARVDGEEVRIAAKERVEIRCGLSSIALSADGRIVIRGRELVSRAEASNKIRGASVQIN